jgi:glycosyltransferase involved in cell wall biosynthesis
MLTNAAIVLVHNEDIEEKIKDWGFPHLLLRDPIPQIQVNENIETAGSIKIKEDKYIIIPGSFASDEPIQELFDAMRLCPDVLFVCTWFKEKLTNDHQKNVPPNLRLTGFLEEQTFTALYANAAAAIVLTTREGTQPSGASEAISLCVPLIVSDIATTRRLYSEAAVFVQSNSTSIAEGINYALNNQEFLRIKIKRLKERISAENNNQMLIFKERLENLEKSLN